MMGTMSPTGGSESDETVNTSWTLEEAGLSEYERRKAVSEMSYLDGVAEVTPDGESGAVVFVTLENGIPFDADDAPNPLSADWDAYDPDNVREDLLTQGYEPHRMATTPEGHVEYAIPLNSDERNHPTHVHVPEQRRTNVTLAVQPSTKERAFAYLRREMGGRDVTPADVPALTEELDEAVYYLSRPRQAICEFFGFDPETAPYGDFRDASDEEQRAYYAKMCRMNALRKEMADLIEEYDGEEASRLRRENIDAGATLQFVPEEWVPERDEQV